MRQPFIQIRRSKTALALGASLMAMVASPAWADCTPDPVPTNGTITCTGTDADGVVIANPNASINVAAGAIVNGQRPIFLNAPASITNAGRIEATNETDPAISASPSPIGTYIAQLQNSAEGYIGGIESGYVSITNSGTISGGSISAINGAVPGAPGLPNIIYNYGTISNNSDLATIQSFAPSNDFYNYGLISNSGSGSAISFGPGFTYFTNSSSGIVSAAGGVALNAGQSQTIFVNNSGTITGAGGAVVGGFNLNVNNQGTINGSIVASRINLRGTGVINGNVSLSSFSPPMGGSVIDLSGGGTINGNVTLLTPAGPFTPAAHLINLAQGGRINGSVTLGGGGDTLIAGFDPLTNSFTSITGTVDAGAGFNRFYLAFAPNSTTVLTSGIALPSTFQQLTYMGQASSRIELAPNFTTSSTMVFRIDPSYDPYAGAGLPAGSVYTVVNQANQTFSGSLFDIAGFPTFGAIFENRGSITSTLSNSNQHAVSVYLGDFSNYGSILVNGGNGVNSSYGSFLNTSSIVADNIALNGYFLNSFLNSGTIESRLGTAVFARISQGRFTNTGTIIGRTTGLDIGNASVLNEGNISSAGVAVRLNAFTDFENAAGATVVGGQYAIASGMSANDSMALSVRNAGSIIGNVDLSNSSGLATGNRFAAVAGSTVNGNLILGNGGDTLAVDASATSRLAGVSGTIAAGPDSSLEYTVSQNLSTSIAAMSATFANVGYGLSDGSTLTLSGAAEANSSYFFEGDGRVILNANLSGNGARPLILLRQRNEYPLSGFVDFTNRAVITGSRTAAGAVAGPLVLVQNGRFTNDGVIVIRDNRGVVGNQMIGILANTDLVTSEIVNNGLILFGSGIGIADYSYSGANIVNNGLISSLDGTRAGIGVLNPVNLVNNGWISTVGTAVRFDSSTSSIGGAGFVLNTGLIEGQRGPAILDDRDFVYPQIVNGVSGVIRSRENVAIRLGSAGAVQNDGIIEGNVELGLSPVSSGSSLFISNGGTLRGNLLFGGSGDILQMLLPRGGITGRTDAGDGIDILDLSTGGSTIRNYDLGRFRNFELLNISGGGEISLRNVPIFQSITTNYTRLMIGSGQTLIMTDQFAQIGGQTQVDGVLRAQGIGIYEGILNGNGSLNAISLYGFGAFIAPNDHGKIGTLTINGDMQLAGDSALLVDIATATNDRLAVRANSTSPGILDLTSAALNISFQGGGPRFGRNYVIATADGGVNGQFTSVQGGQIGVLTPVVTYNARDITLRFNAGSLAAALPAGASQIEIAFANALDSLRTGHYTNLASLYGAVDLMDPVSRGLTLSGLAPTGINETIALGREQNGIITGIVSDRLSLLGTRGARRGKLTLMGSPNGLPGLEKLASPTAVAAQSSFAANMTSGQSVAGTLPDNMSGFVSMGFGEGKSSLADPLSGSQSGRHTWHMAMGLEIGIDDATTIGTAVAYAEGDSRVFGNQTGIRTSQAIAYGSNQLGDGGYVAGLAAVALNRFGLSRSASDSQSLQRLGGNASALSAEARIEAGWNVGIADGFTLTPKASLSAMHMRYGKLREGGGELALQISNIRDKRINVKVGMKLAGSLPLGAGWSFSPQLEASYGRRLADGDGTMTLRFDAADAVAFQLPLSLRSGQWIEAKGGFRLANDWLTLSAGFETESGNSATRENRGAVAISVAF
jgi:hypothetical protein